MLANLLAAFLVSTNVLTDIQHDFVSRSADERRTVYLDKDYRLSLLKRAVKSATPVLPAATVESPLVILDPTVPNVRDFGGWRTTDGKRIRRGRIFRSAGLNDNARDRKPTPADLAAVDPEGALGSVREPVTRLAARYAALTNDLSAMKIVRCDVPKTWRRVTLDDGLTALEAAVWFARGLPTGGGDELDAEDGCVTIGSLGPGKWAALSGTLTAEDDGFAVVRCAADWFWALAVNGVPVCDYLDGNRGSPAETQHEITIPVRRGANALTAIVGAGSSAYAFWLNSGTGGAKDGLVSHELKRLTALPETLCGHACGYEKGKSRITDANRAFWLETLGIRSDIDLRSDRECRGMDGSPLGPTVAWHHISSNAYGGLQTENGRNAFARVFRVFLDEKNYPIVFHCIAGQDRTGAVAYILGALLGMSDNDLALDWELSAFANRSLGFSHARLYDGLVEGFRRHHPAPTVRESVEHYVLSLGFTRDDIARFREAMLCGASGQQIGRPHSGDED